MTAELRRNLVLALVGLAGGFALIVALFGSAELMKRPSAPAEQGGASAAKPNTPGEAGAGKPGAAAPSPAGKPAESKSAEAKPDSAKPDSAKADGVKPDAATDAKVDSKADSRAPSFDLVRVEPTGETVVAGRGLPNTAVEMLVNGKPVAKALADPNGQFALVPPALGPGNSEIVLRLTDQQGRETRSGQSVAVVVSPDRRTRPLVALSSPDSPTVVLSQPETAVAAAGAGPEAGSAQADPGASPRRTDKAADGAGRPAAAGHPAGQDVAGAMPAADRKAPALKIVSVDAQEGGRLYVTGQAAPGATVRLYLNDTLVAPASVGPDGKVVFTIGRGVAAGDYRVRVDQVDPVTGAVRTRAEVPFVFPENAARVAAREPAREGAHAGTGKAVAAVPPPGVKPEHAGVSPGATDHAAAPAASGKPGPAPGGAPAVADRHPDRPGGGGVAAAPASASAPAPKKADALAGIAEAPAANAGGAFVAEIATARITRGDNLWQISRRVYGSGLRYTVIYDANQDQIRDPDRIFPGQIFVLPKDEKGGRG